jgi:hypothetical protein
MFLVMTRSLSLNGAHERCFTRVGYDLTHKHQTRLDKLAREKTNAYYEHSPLTAIKSFITLTTGLNVIKLITVRNLQIFVISYTVCPWQAFPAQSNVLGKNVEHIKGASLGKAQTLPANIRLALPGTNTLSHYEQSLITTEKSFIRLTPGANIIKLFSHH